MNYFRSVERTITINDVGLTLNADNLKATSKQTRHGSGSKGLGSHQYIHNTPVDYLIDKHEFMQRSEIENHDDFYEFEEGMIHVQDQRGFFVMYDAALADFK